MPQLIDFQNVEIINSEDKIYSNNCIRKTGGVLDRRNVKTDHLFVNEYDVAGINRVINPGIGNVNFFH